MSMRKEWFEDTKGYPSRFLNAWWHVGGGDIGETKSTPDAGKYDGGSEIGDIIAATFRTLLAEDAAADDKPTDTLWHYHVDAQLDTLERKVKRLRKRGKCHGNEILDVDGRLQKVESFLAAYRARVEASKGERNILRTNENGVSYQSFDMRTRTSDRRQA